jgi:hypothetical protein
MSFSNEAGRIWPKATEFLSGQALGAGVPYETIAITSYYEEMLELYRPAQSKCSTYVAPSTRGFIIGHNEDWGKPYLGNMVLLDATFDGFPRVIGVSFLGMLPNLAGSLNSRGVAITNNSLHPEARPGLSKQLQHFRASLASSLEEAIEHLARQPVSLATHYTVAHGPSGQVVSLEVCNRDIVHDGDVVLVTVGPGPFCHTNHVLNLNLREPDPAILGGGNQTLARRAKLQSQPRKKRPRTPEQMRDFLSTNDGVLHRTPAQNPTSVTLATIVIRPSTGEMWIRDADPDAEQRDWYFSILPSMLN